MRMSGRMKTFGSFGWMMVAAFAVAASIPASATIYYQDLGTAAPPASLGPFTVTPFDQFPQSLIPDFTDVTAIPGSSYGGDLLTSVTVNKRTIGSGWATWSHGYTGAVYFDQVNPTSLTLTLPAGTSAFYFYVESNSFSTFYFTATTNTGRTSGAQAAVGNAGARGFGFFSNGVEKITSITITTSASAGGFSVGEFGGSTVERSFHDDADRSSVCIDFVTGDWTYTILSGPYAYWSWSGPGKVLNAGGKVISVGGNPDYMSFQLDPVRLKAKATFISSDGIYSPLVDSNVTDDPAECGQGQEGPPR